MRLSACLDDRRVRFTTTGVSYVPNLFEELVMPTEEEMEAWAPTEEEMEAWTPTEEEMEAMTPSEEEIAEVMADPVLVALLNLDRLLPCPVHTFSVSYRAAAKALNLNYHEARNMFHLLEREGWIEQTAPGQRSSHPTEYRWLV